MAGRKEDGGGGVRGKSGLSAPARRANGSWVAFFLVAFRGGVCRFVLVGRRY